MSLRSASIAMSHECNETEEMTAARWCLMNHMRAGCILHVLVVVICFIIETAHLRSCDEPVVVVVSLAPIKSIDERGVKGLNPNALSWLAVC